MTQASVPGSDLLAHYVPTLRYAMLEEGGIGFSSSRGGRHQGQGKKLLRNCARATLVGIFLVLALGGASTGVAAARVAEAEAFPDSHDTNLVENWCRLHARHTFAGLYWGHVKPDGTLEKNARLVVSFTEGERRRVRWLRRHLALDRPDRLVGSPLHPRYPLIYLERLANHLPWYHGLVKADEVDEKANIVVVETEHVQRVRSLLWHRYGHKGADPGDFR